MNQLNKLIEQYPGDQKEITKYSNIYQQDFKKTNLKELVNE